ncbi:Saccharopine dehydrogenase-domain-containing protein [Chytridium lagenaria]|nr:Saccharopine dehydrogenase-domain-containing protein [Chytridium lagenaria]
MLFLRPSSHQRKGVLLLLARPLSAHAQYAWAASPPNPHKPLSLGIRREDKNRWERRVPLVPDHVERLVKELGVKVIVQPSTKRVIPDEKYLEVGAEVKEDLSEADIIVGVKEGQKYNMPMLKDILEKVCKVAELVVTTLQKIRLIDYELMKDSNDRRLVFFSRFAGYAGFLDGINGLGHRLLALGYGNPFLACGLSYMYRCLADARLDLTRTGQVIMDDGLPKELGPLIFVFTGDGNVTKGALHVFKCLPHEWVKPEDLKALVAPYASVLVNGIFWDERFPRLLTADQASALAIENRFRMLQIADGSLEFMSKATTIDQPFFMYDPVARTEHTDTEGNGVQIMSIDNLPTEMPLEASEYFGDALFPFIMELVKGNFNHPVLKKATITTNDGKLEESHTKLYDSIEQFGKPHGIGIKVTGRKNVLLLGSGYVAAPLVDYLLRSKDNHITIASNSLDEARKLSQNRSTTTVQPLDVSDHSSLSSLVSSSDIVVSFVPASLHPIVAEKCIELKKHLVTASYISPAMKKLNDRAKNANITILNEIGLDPGIDHLTAMKLFDEVKERGGQITSFVSWCGGLPAPEASNNPLGYKFSWSPKGVLLAGLNSALFKKNGKIVEIPGPELMKSSVDVNIYPGFALEGLPNRDSLGYLETYNLGDGSYVDTMFRGTLRYKGYAELMGAFVQLGLLNTEAKEIGGNTSWAALLARILGLSTIPKGRDAWRNAVNSKLQAYTTNPVLIERVFESLEWMDMTSEHHPVHPSPTILDAFCALLQAKLVYAQNERDTVIMHHEFGIRWSGEVNEHRTSTLISYGEPSGYSAMAKTVGLPAAIATDMILKGEIYRTGVLAPVYKDIYDPLLVQLEKEGIQFHDVSRLV